MKFFTYHLTSPTGEKVEYMTGDKSASKLIAGHDIRVDWIEKQGWKVERAVLAPKPPLEATTAPQATFGGACEVCGKPLTFKEGISKAGKPYKGYFCPEKGHPVQWVK